MYTASSSLIPRSLFAISSPPKCYRTEHFPSRHSQFLSSKSILRPRTQTWHSNPHFDSLRKTQARSLPEIVAAQSNFLKVAHTIWRVGKDAIEAGTSMVPESIPRPVARISVTVVGLSVALFVLKSFLSTAFFVLATMGLIYFAFLALNKDNGPRGSDKESPSMDDPVEEARKIMEKYK